MKKGRSMNATVLAFVLALAVSGCANMSPREEGTAKGAAAGAVGGAVIGAVTGGGAARGAVIGGVVGAVAGNLWSKRMEDKRIAMERATAGSSIEVARTADDQLKLSVPSDLSFDVGSAELKPALRPVLEQFAQGLGATAAVRIVGHTDSTGSAAINDPLSVHRAQSVRDFLVTRGVPAQRMSVEGRGAREPIADNATEAGRARNRRVEIFLSEPRG